MKKTLNYIFTLLSVIVLVFSLLGTRPVSAYSENIGGGNVYLIRNRATGKYLNVNYGTDANGTNVTQFSKDGSIEQKWRVTDYYYSRNTVNIFYAMCSNNGYGRVLDVLRTGGSSNGDIVSGCNVDIWSLGDDDAQFWEVVQEGPDGSYVIYLFGTGLCLTTYGTGNGSGSGTSSTSNGNVFVSQFTGSNNQYWYFENAY